MVKQVAAQIDRQLLKNVAMGTVVGWRALGAGKSLKGTAINHVSYALADYKRTRDFYRDLFGFQVSEEDDKQDARLLRRALGSAGFERRR